MMTIKVCRFLLTGAALALFSFLNAATGVCQDSAPAPKGESVTEKPGTDRATPAFDCLADPAVATSVRLSDEQKQLVAELLDVRDEALAAADDDAKPGISADADAKLKEVLSAEQRRLFAALFSDARLKFNFRLQKWPEVLDWFADEAGLSLVMDEAPPGTFNYSDAKEYSTTEAIDLLNGWLLTKGYTLIRRERLLMCVSLKEGLPEGAIPRVALEELAIRGRFEFVSVMFPLEGRLSEAVVSEVTPLLGTYGKVQSLPATAQVLISGTAGTLREVLKIAAQVPVPDKPAPAPPKPPKAELTVYPIEHANPQQAGEVLKQIIDGTILVDETANQITINAIPAEHAKAKIVINQLESNQGPDRQRELQVYPMRMRNSSESLATLQLIVPDAQYRFDDTSGKLVVWATPTDQIRVATALRKLEADQPGRGATQLEVYRLTRIDPSSAQSLITNLLPDAKVTIDARTQSLIAIGTLSEHQAIHTLIEQLQPQSPDEETPELKSYPSENLNIDTVTSLLTTLAPRAQITADSENQRLLVVAAPGQHEEIAETLKQLAETPDAPKRELTTYPIKPEDAKSATSLLSSLVPKADITHDTTNERLVVIATAPDHEQISALLERIASADSEQTVKMYPASGIDVSSVMSLLSTLAPAATISNDATNQRLIVIASANDHATVENVVQQVATDEPDGDPELKSYPVQPQVTFSILTQLLATVAPDTKITSDEVSRRLLVVATARDHAIVQSTIQQVEKDSGGELPELKFYPLKKADGSNAVTILQTVSPSASISFEAAARRLSVVATKADHAAVLATLAKLEESAPSTEKRTLKIHAVTVTQRTRFEELLAGLQEELPGLQVITDAEPDELAVWATPSEQESVEQILAQLQRDVPPEQKRRLIVYPITKTDPAGVSEVLTILFPGAKITVDEKASRLLIHARPAEHDTIRSAIEQLDTDAPVEKEIKLMAYPVKGLNSSVALSLLQEELPELTVIQDTTAESFIVRGSLQDHGHVVELLDALRTASSSGTKRSLIVYPLLFANSSLAKSFMTSAFPEANAFPDDESGRMTVWATSADHERLRVVTAEMTADTGDNRGPRLERYPLKGVTAASLSPLLSRVAPDARTAFSGDNSVLVVWGRPGDHTAISQLVTEMSGDSTTVRSLGTFDVKSTGASLAQTVLTTVVPEVTFLSADSPDVLLAWVDEAQQQRIETTLKQLASTDAVEGERDLKFYPVDANTISDTRTVLAQVVPSVSLTATADGNRLMARVTSAEDEQIQSTLQKLDDEKPFARQRDLKFYSIASAGPQATSVLSRSVPSAVINEGSKSDQLMIEATAPEHSKITELLTLLESEQESSERTLQFYKIANLGSATEITDILSRATADVSFTESSDGSRLLAWVMPDEHQKISVMLEQLATTQPFRTNRTMEAYSIFGLGSEARSVLSAAVPNASISSGPKPDQIIVVARAEEHAELKKVLERLNGLKGPHRPKSLKVYDLDGVDPDAVRSVVQPLVDKDVQLTVDPSGKRLFVRAFADKQAAIGSIVEQVAGNVTTRKGVTTQAYWVGNSNADKAQEAMQELFPDAILAIDADRKLLVATALPEEHVTISEVVEQMSGGANSNDLPQARKYSLPNVSSKNLVRVFGELFSSRDGVRFVTDTETGTMIAVAPARHHETIAGVISQFEADEKMARKRKIEFYPLAGADGDTVEDLVEDLLEPLDSQATIVHESGSRQLVVTTITEGHERVASLIENLGRPENREIEVLQLSVLEPSTAEYAISAMFDFDDPDGFPTVQSDEDAQQLLIRATKPQLEQIRQLLTKMGELSVASDAIPRTSTRNLRIIPLGGYTPLEVDTAIQRIEQLWPRLRPNPIRVIRPGENNSSGQFSVPDTPPLEPASQSPQKTEPDQTAPENSETPRPAGDASTASRGNPLESTNTVISNPPTTPPHSTDAPVVLIPGNGRLTVTSDDTEALGQMESLLRSIFLRSGGRVRGRDFTIYALRNAGADEAANTLNRIFEEARSITSGNVVIVPDQRLNALIVFAGRSDRERLESLIEALDSERSTDSLTAYETRVIPIQHADAQRVSSVLSGIYRAEMSAGGARQSISIPEGVSSDVASVLRQINAAASSPLLTVQAQSTTNSLVVKAPQNLLDEVETLIQKLDEATVTRSKGLTLIPLRRTSSKRILQALGGILD